MRRLLPLLLLAVYPLNAQSPSAAQQYSTLAKSLREARSSKNFHAYLASAKLYAQLLNHSPESLLPLARAYTLNNDLPSAVAIVKQFVAMGQSTNEFRDSSDFAPLRKLPEFPALQAAMKANESTISLATKAFTLDTLSGQITEDIAYDSNSPGSFFFTTVLGRNIYASTAAAQIRSFAASPDGWPILAVKVDSSRGLLWATAVGLRDFNGVPASAYGKSAILCYALPSGKLLRRIDPPTPATFGDFAITIAGDLILSDNEGAGIYFLGHDSTTLERLDNGQFLSPQTPTLAADENLILVPDYSRGIAVLNRATRELRWLDSQNKFALSGIDGLYFTNGKLIATQNGTSPERVVLFTLDAALTRVTSETVIERSTSTLGDPTHGVILGNDFFYIANSGWDTLDDHGNLKPDAKPSAPHLMRFPIPN